jgi:hypothetical protein
MNTGQRGVHLPFEVVALKQDGPWTYGVLANHIGSFAGNDERDGISKAFLQPFLSYTTPDACTFFLL